MSTIDEIVCTCFYNLANFRKHMLEVNKQKILDKLPRVKRAIMEVNYTVILERIPKNQVRLDNSMTQ